MKIATSVYRPVWHADQASLEARLEAWVADAANAGAQILVFPEYGGVEAAMIGEQPKGLWAVAWAERVADAAEGWVQLHARLAQRYGVYILAGSLMARAAQGIVNRSYFLSPEGGIDWYDKLVPTPWERQAISLAPGQENKLFETPFGKIGIQICYDSEFPLFTRALVERGADIILVPSATDFEAGYTRVRQSCRARAIESQCLIVHSPVLGPVEDCPLLEQGTGSAAIFCAPDYGLPQNGIIAQGAVDAEGWVIAEVDPARISASRTSGQVNNFAHWPEQDHRVNSVTTRPFR
jgi:predicted amidohydrolase